MGRKVFRAARRSERPAGPGRFRRAVFPFVLFWRDPGRFQRSELCLFVWQFADVGDFFVDSVSRVRRRRRKRRIGRGWGWWRRWRLVICRVSLSRCDSLHAKRITARPAHFVFCLTVWANRDASNFFPETCRTDNAHALLTFSATENFLQRSSLLDLFSAEVPPALQCYYQLVEGRTAKLYHCCQGSISMESNDGTLPRISASASCSASKIRVGPMTSVK